MWRFALVAAGLLFPVAARAQAAPGSAQTTGAWNFSYDAPSGWQAEGAGGARVFRLPDGGGTVFVVPGLFENAAQAEGELSGFFESLNLQAQPIEAPAAATIAGLPATLATYLCQDQSGNTLEGRYVFLLTPHGTGLVIIGLGLPERMTQVRPSVERIAASVRAGPPAVNGQMVAALAGSWVHSKTEFSGSGQRGSTGYDYTETVVFDGRGAYQWESSSMVSITTAPEFSLDGNSTSSDSDQGTYTVIGNTLVLSGRQGRTAFELDYRGDVILANGKTYHRR